MSRKQPHIRNQLYHHSPEFVDKVLPYFKIFEYYFRYSVVGLENIPVGKPCLVVVNHGIFPFHGFLLTMQCIEKLRLYPRGLGAGFIFDIPIIRDFFLKGGAVNANPKNAKALLKQGYCVMLSPGGIYESLVSYPGMRRIPWERRTGFVRVAVDAKVPIIPTYGHGIEKTYLNSKFLLKQRIKIMEKTRFSMPLLMGIGILPFPAKLTHYVGCPISSRKKKGETIHQTVRRVHSEVIEEMYRLKGSS